MLAASYAHAFHQVAVGHDAESAVVDDGVAGAVVRRRQVRFGDGQANAVGKTLTERPGGQLDAGRQAVLGVAGCPAAPLAELLQLVQ